MCECVCMCVCVCVCVCVSILPNFFHTCSLKDAARYESVCKGSLLLESACTLLLYAGNVLNYCI
jgi:hypothetical protein